MAEDKTESEIEATEEEAEEVLIPKSFFAGKDLEIGSKCKIKVEAIYDDEVSVSYVKPKTKDKDGKDSDDDDDDDNPKRRRRHHHHDDSDLMRESLSQMEMMSAPPPAMGGY